MGFFLADTYDGALMSSRNSFPFEETLEDKPIDQLPAEEVEDEEIEENVNQNDGDERVTVRQSEEVNDEEVIEDNHDLVKNCLLFLESSSS